MASQDVPEQGSAGERQSMEAKESWIDRIFTAHLVCQRPGREEIEEAIKGGAQLINEVRDQSSQTGKEEHRHVDPGLFRSDSLTRKSEITSHRHKKEDVVLASIMGRAERAQSNSA